MVGISRLLLFRCCIGKESLERAFGLDLSVEVAEMTSAENFEETFKVATLKHKKYTANVSPIKSAGNPCVAKCSL